MHLRRPGSRFLQYDKRSVEHAVQQAQRVMRAEMYDTIKNELSTSWRSPGSIGNHADAMPVNDSREAAYAAYDAEIQNAWRRK